MVGTRGRTTSDAVPHPGRTDGCPRTSRIGRQPVHRPPNPRGIKRGSGDEDRADPARDGPRAGNTRRGAADPRSQGRRSGGLLAVARQIIDLSIFLENEVISDPPGYRPKIEYIDHKMSVPEITGFFPGLQA